MDPDTLQKAKNRSLNFLSFRPRSIHETRHFLLLKRYSQEIIDFNGPKKFSPSELQKKFNVQLINQLNMLKNKEDRVQIQQAVFDSIRLINIKPKEAFEIFYQKLINKSFGMKEGVD